LFLSVCILLFVDFNTKKYALLSGFMSRLSLALIIGFGVFFYTPVWVRIVVTVFVMIVLSILSTVMSETQLSLTAFCTASLLFGFFMGFFIYRGVWITDSVRLPGILIIISMFSVLSYFLLNNVNTVRWFSTHRLSIPGSIKRSSFALLSVLCLLISLISLSPWILRAIEAFFSAVVKLIRSLIDLLMSFLQPPPVTDQLEGGSGFPPVFEQSTEAGMNELFARIMAWLTIAILIGAAVFLIIKLIILIVKLLMRLFKVNNNQRTPEYEVFTEVIEKITPGNKKRATLRYARKPRYSSLLTDRERILFIYNEYAKRAKRYGFTQNKNSDTPNEVLYEVSKNLSNEKLPMPGDLGLVYNAVRYNDDDVYATGADDLKRKLL